MSLSRRVRATESATAATLLDDRCNFMYILSNADNENTAAASVSGSAPDAILFAHRLIERRLLPDARGVA